MFSERIMPALHTSSFEAADAIRGPIPRSADPVIVGFEQQVRAVSVAVEALIERSVLEGTDLIIEGAHLVPGFIESPTWSPPWEDKAVVVHDRHHGRRRGRPPSHFFLRAMDAGQRNVERYLTSLRQHPQDPEVHPVRGRATRGVPVISSYSLDATLAAVIDHVVEQAVKRTVSPASSRIEDRNEGASDEALLRHRELQGDRRDQRVGRPRRRHDEPDAAREGSRTAQKDYKQMLKEICAEVDGAVSAEVVSTDTEGMLREAAISSQIADNIYVKFPCIPAGLAATKVAAGRGHPG